MPEKIFDKGQRERIHSTICMVVDPGQTRAYLKTLEEIAKAAATFWQECGNDLIPFDQLPPAEQKLMKALDNVDWMRNE